MLLEAIFINNNDDGGGGGAEGGLGHRILCTFVGVGMGRHICRNKNHTIQR